MKIGVLLGIVLLGGCAPLGVYYKAGAPVAAADRALLECRVDAANTVPVQQVTRVIPGPRMPPRRVCDSEGNCTMVPGHYMPPEIVSEDANARLRKQVVTQCMADQGYQFVRIPNCSAGISQAVTPQQTKVFPRLTGDSCVVRDGGVWQIVTPG